MLRTNPPTFARTALLLGLFTAAGPIGIDLYLPAFPQIQDSYSADTSALQISLVSYLLALAVGQLFYGPISDRFGRRAPLAVGFALFLMASVGAALSQSIDELIKWRFAQGLGSCAGMVIASSIARDVASGATVARLFSMIVLVLGVSPILAPSLGAGLISLFTWPVTFWFMAGFAFVVLLVIVLQLEETLAPFDRSAKLGIAFKQYQRLISDQTYLRVVMSGAFSQAGFFAYIAGSPQVIISLHGISPAGYSVLFGLNALALVGSAQFTGALLRRFDPDQIIKCATSLYMMMAIILLVLTLLQLDGLPVTVILLFLITTCLGLILPITAMQAMDGYQDAAGAASGLMGAIQFGAGALASILLSQVVDDSSRPLAAVIALCAAFAIASYYWLAPQRRQLA